MIIVQKNVFIQFLIFLQKHLLFKMIKHNIHNKVNNKHNILNKINKRIINNQSYLISKRIISILFYFNNIKEIN